MSNTPNGVDPTSGTFVVPAHRPPVPVDLRMVVAVVSIVLGALGIGAGGVTVGSGGIKDDVVEMKHSLETLKADVGALKQQGAFDSEKAGASDGRLAKLETRVTELELINAKHGR